MGFVTLKELKRLIHPHHLLNFVLAVSYLFTKLVSPFCTFLYPKSGCELEFKETEILIFLAVIVLLRTKKRGAVQMIPYLTSLCMYAKLANIALFFYSDPRFGVVYAVLCLIHLLLLPEPTYEGPDNVIYFTGQNLEEELKKDTRMTWLVTFYTVWNSNCVNFAPIFAEMSVKYGLDNLKFGKVDATRYPEVAEKFHVSTSAFSKQLPTVILFRNGKEVNRRPTVDAKCQLIKFFFSEENLTAALDLNNIYQECKNNPIKKHKREDAERKENAVDHIKAE
ncbi:thioredoxin-related transmembrane protein 2 homolog [Trichonephila inaurata madagascariensis]|uniref:Thioredoxin-related transmembrane protein 2 homolog n=1 Tax=Trichonephila inaurata madagascariensis TaxID=2747483 RepID=A0A8X6YAC8_9ARAC|nr:thioredoxin-related transmembrane protein 2 homolog [Trichonephila inaurata madagascariensis]